jgi:hypothetical protein
MTLHPTPSLDDQAIAYNSDDRVLLVTQRWSGFVRGLHAEVYFRFTPEGACDLQLERTGMPRTVLERFRAAAAAMTGRAVTETRAREILTELGHPAAEHCPADRCRARLPLGGRFCVACGQPHHVPGTGARRTPIRAA